ncbi:SDR family NAD(P)-dependent oxidoreductase [Mumia sp. zg.B17]|uniref:SDR family NAD(P)-dependent oxidoreductase n=1 Tax=Mumia sp. zg.B17 TaxID=2855446 RepID=UPI001C6E5C4F|nr:SDR family NAD(P)-dependent oxidoreductase [Mumia sp. zg.B17]MBW9206419.1 SDR family NAD(P)-dependent oxidoreductase [Mumia sp. zg.B17]
MPTIVMTGGSSGIGATAAEKLAQSDDARLLVGARGTAPYGEVLPLDLTRLASTRRFASAVEDLLGEAPIDALVLNAGGIGRDVAGRTEDGFETTFAMNHLAHYLLLRRLVPRVAEDGAVVITTSGSHDPATGAGLEAPRHADAVLLAHPDRDPGTHDRARKAAEHAYTASKLCVVLTVRALSVLADVRQRRVTAVAFCPGQVFGTGLARSLPLPMRAAWSALGGPVLGRPLRAVNATHNTREAAGDALADLALGRTRPPAGRTYAALRRGRITWPEPSVRARDAATGAALWADSALLAGLTS